MDRPANKIGSTAREYQAGDTLSAVLRGVAEGNPAAEIMPKKWECLMIEVDRVLSKHGKEVSK
jgi:hypothetical protein